MKKILATGLLLFVLLISTPFMLRAESSDTAVGAELGAISSYYTAYINDYISNYTSNPFVIQALLNLLAQLNALQGQTGDGSAMDYGDGSTYDAMQDLYDFWPVMQFGAESTITSVVITTSNNGNAQIIMTSDDNERIESTISYHYEDERSGTSAGYEAGYDYYRDDELVRSRYSESLSYANVVNYMEDQLADTEYEGEGGWFTEFLINNPRVYRHSSFAPGATDPVDCHYSSQKDTADAMIEAMFVKDNRDFEAPIADITEYYVPTVFVERSASGCATASTYTPGFER